MLAPVAPPSSPAAARRIFASESSCRNQEAFYAYAIMIPIVIPWSGEQRFFERELEKERDETMTARLAHSQRQRYLYLVGHCSISSIAISIPPCGTFPLP